MPLIGRRLVTSSPSQMCHFAKLVCGVQNYISDMCERHHRVLFYTAPPPPPLSRRR